MYQNKIKLMPQDILEKNFKIDTRGYRLKEVDQFLDDIISDYEQFLSIISNLEKEKADFSAHSSCYEPDHDGFHAVYNCQCRKYIS